MTKTTMLHVPGGVLLMGSDRFYPEEAPQREVRVAAFQMDAGPVSNGEFARFVAETHHRTVAEVEGGSLVFGRHDNEIGSWAWIKEADWKRPAGPTRHVADVSDHPVVHVAPSDARAYAAWAGKRLPTEAEWEWAATGGLQGLDYAWGETLEVAGVIPANIWKGVFPTHRIGGLTWPLTTSVGAYPPNGFGLSDMIGNVWEITADAAPQWLSRSCACPQKAASSNLQILKGGSHLCADNYCRRYRPAARQQFNGTTSHIGFRCAV